MKPQARRIQAIPLADHYANEVHRFMREVAALVVAGLGVIALLFLISA